MCYLPILFLVVDALLPCGGGNSFFSFNYHLFNTVNGSCSTATWNYHEFGCTPAMYIIQGFDFEDVVSRHFNSPRVEFHSLSTTIVIPTDYFTVYFRIIGINTANETCATSEFFNILRNG